MTLEEKIKQARSMILKEEEKMAEALKYHRKRDGTLTVEGMRIAGYRGCVIKRMEEILKLFERTD